MKKVKDLSPRMNVLNADMELFTPPGTPMMGDRVAGLQAFSNKFKRGHGDNVFGNDENGLWLGKAEYEDAPFRVDYGGNAYLNSATFADENNTVLIDPTGLVSDANFVSGYIEDFTLQNTTSTSFVDVANSEFAPFTLTRNTRFLINVQVQSRNPNFNTDSSYCQFIVADNGTPIVLHLGFGLVNSLGVQYEINSSSRIVTLAPGSHVLKLQYRLGIGSTGSARIGSFNFYYLQLGN